MIINIFLFDVVKQHYTYKTAKSVSGKRVISYTFLCIHFFCFYNTYYENHKKNCNNITHSENILAHYEKNYETLSFSFR